MFHTTERGIAFFLAVLVTVTQCEYDSTFEPERNAPLQRDWGISDTTAYVGYLFSFQIPHNAFKGVVTSYKASIAELNKLPHWVVFDKKTGLFEGVPSDADAGEFYITVRAFNQNHDTAKDVFALDVLTNKNPLDPINLHNACPHQDSTVFSLILDMNFYELSPRSRVNLLREFSGFLGVNPGSLRVFILNETDDMLHDGIISAGPGSSKSKQKTFATSIQWKVGCFGSIGPEYENKIELLKEAAKDGTLMNLLRHPILGWRIARESPQNRRKRQLDENEEKTPLIPERQSDSLQSSINANLAPTPKVSLDVTTDGNVDEIDRVNKVDEGINTNQIYSSVPEGNRRPIIENRLKKQSVEAGKFSKIKIPHNYFKDVEDGDAKNLTLTLENYDNGSLPRWMRLYSEALEIWLLPSLEDTSGYNVNLVATDSGGLSEKDTLPIKVHQKQVERTINHEFILELTKKPDVNFEDTLVWALPLIKGIKNVFSSPESVDDVTVLFINDVSSPVYFHWANSSFFGQECLTESEGNYVVTSLMKDNALLKNNLWQLFKSLNASWKGRGDACMRTTSSVQQPPKGENSPPTIPNQIDSITATVGELLVYQVPSDFCFDQEDGNTPKLTLSLKLDQTDSQFTHDWLDFDGRNQEFFGIPMESDIGRKKYQLNCEDKQGLMSSDGLVVNVNPSPPINYNVEFTLKLNVSYQKFNENPNLKRHFVQRLKNLFGDKDTSSIVISRISSDPVVITWHNKTLPTNYCPDDEITKLRKVISGDDEEVLPSVASRLGPDFPVLWAGFTPIGTCLSEVSVVSGGGIEVSSNNDVTAVSQGEQYLISLVVPAVVIAVMLLCAGLVACVLYRRRRTGKMSVGDEDERQSFRSKGIPVIFQDELDERPEPTNKSPVIMKEEKPPLPPPEYQRGPPLATTALLSDTEDSLYQPPPPFTGSKDSARPKPTPTYRMPPPYVPP